MLLRKIWNAVSTALVVLVVILALLLVGARLVGLQVFTVLSGSMEPTYHTGSLIYVKKVDPLTVQAGEVITLMLDEDTVATHRVVEVVPDEEDASVVRFRTKGDANDSEDAGLVHSNNLLGTPVFTIPTLATSPITSSTRRECMSRSRARRCCSSSCSCPMCSPRTARTKKSGKAGKDSDGSAPQADGPAPDAPDEAAHK